MSNSFTKLLSTAGLNTVGGQSDKNMFFAPLLFRLIILVKEFVSHFVRKNTTLSDDNEIFENNLCNTSYNRE